MNDEDRQRIVRINAWFAAQPVVALLDDADLFYARELGALARRRVREPATTRQK